jgi:hypothetical protein
MPLYIRKNPNPATLLAKAYVAAAPEGYEPSTEEAASEWVAAQLAAGWVPAHPAPEPVSAEPLHIDSDTVLQRLTAAEREALFSARRTVWQVDYFLTRASSTGIISTADADLPAAQAMLAQLGIVAADRWPALLAP